MKKTALTFFYACAAVICLTGLQAHAKSGVEGVTPASDTESVTVDVTRTSEGIEVVTPDGRRVLLRDDHTWEVIETGLGDPAKSAVISVANTRGLRNACKVGLRLENHLGYNIKSLIPSFSAYTREGVLFETRSKAFSSIKPTKNQYRQVQFIGITCEDIGHVRVHGAEHCSMGLMDKFNEAEGECLSHIYVQPSDLIKITK